MNVNAHEIDKMDDVRVLVLARAQGPFGLETARRHANALMKRAMGCFEEQNYNAAMRLAARELDFNAQAFGVADSYTQSSKRCLDAMKHHYEREAWVSAASTQQLQAQRMISRVG